MSPNNYLDPNDAIFSVRDPYSGYGTFVDRQRELDNQTEWGVLKQLIRKVTVVGHFNTARSRRTQTGYEEREEVFHTQEQAESFIASEWEGTDEFMGYEAVIEINDGRDLFYEIELLDQCDPDPLQWRYIVERLKESGYDYASMRRRNSMHDSRRVDDLRNRWSKPTHFSSRYDINVNFDAWDFSDAVAKKIGLDPRRLP